MPTADARHLLQTALQAAVPLHMYELRTTPPEQRIALARDATQTIAEHGDQLLYRDKKTAEVFNTLARGLAAAAFQPGGVRFLDCHWCAAECDCAQGQRRSTIPAAVEATTIHVELITHAQAERWSGRSLSPDDMLRIAKAIENSSIPDAFGGIAAGIDWEDDSPEFCSSEDGALRRGQHHHTPATAPDTPTDSDAETTEDDLNTYSVFGLSDREGNLHVAAVVLGNVNAVDSEPVGGDMQRHGYGVRARNPAEAEDIAIALCLTDAEDEM